jgi:hypothetical protein
VKRSGFLALVVAAGVVFGILSVQAASASYTGKWKVQFTTSQGLSTGIVTLNQVGTTIVGHGTAAMNTINGTMVSDTKMNGTWEGPHGAGWLTIYFSASGNSFQGTWGYNGRKSNGSIIGKRAM